MCVKALSVMLNGVAEVPSVLDLAVHGLTADSREVRPGDAFVALAGRARNPWRFVDEAIQRGAVAILLETGGETGCSEQSGALVVQIPQLDQHQAVLADRFFDSPSQALHVIGVTGTNGKSSVTRFLASILNAAGLRTATLGTLGYGFPDDLTTASHTTPDAITVQRWLHRFRTEGASAVVMEVSSHALAQGRVSSVHFEGAIFTNISRDHLDYHGTMENYSAAKAHLFTSANPRFAIINVDDAFGRRLSEIAPVTCQVWRYSMASGSEAQIRLSELSLNEAGFDAGVETPVGALAISSTLLGHFNVSNVLAALGAALALNIEARFVAEAIRTLKAPVGRLQLFTAADGLRVVVDYAHTPDALQTALSALASHVNGDLWCVFGCGGERDTGKRPLMGEVAERLASRVIITDDNPRGENPEEIVDGILEGISHPKNIRVEHARERAIECAITEAAADDLVLVAGKGHEDYQESQGIRRPFSDIGWVEQVIAQRDAGSRLS